MAMNVMRPSVLAGSKKNISRSLGFYL